MISANMKKAIELNKAVGHHFFDEDTMRFWGSRLESDLLPNDIFITSERNFDNTKRLFSVRQFNWTTGHATTILFQQFDNLKDALTYAEEYQEGDEDNE